MWWKSGIGLRVAGWVGLTAGMIAIVVLSASPTRATGGEPAGGQIGSPPASGDASGPVSDLVVHEWGTFLGMNGSDGTALDAMYHEEHALPGFVHGRARDQLRMPWLKLLIKGETPVIYFYTKSPVRVRVGVDFPQGTWTHWYPQAAQVSPSLAEQAERPDSPKDGRICWYADVVPAPSLPAGAGERSGRATGAAPPLPATGSDALWNFARDVDAAFVQTTDSTGPAPRAESERFLFYRGLGRARLPLHADARDGGTLSLDGGPRAGEAVRDLFVIRVEGGRGAYSYRPELGVGERATGVIPTMDGSRPLAEFAAVVADELAARLVATGLYPKEARAMVNTWKASYFQNDGIRVLFVLPRSWTDAFIPMRIHPAPRELVRVMVGRLELLTPERERRAEAAVGDLASGDPDRRREAFAFLREQGRYVEPIVRRVAATTRDEGVRALCRRLLTTELVTDLRAAIHNAADGARVVAVPAELRAQLARLYREMGMMPEARAEATALWRDLRCGPQGSDARGEDAPHVREGRAAVHEALGDDGRAAEDYAGRIGQQARSLPPELNPSVIAWLRDWWVGRAYAGCLMRAGTADSTIARLQRELDRSPGGTDGLAEHRTRRLLLAFLLGARGRHDRAEVQWSSLAAGPTLAQNQE